MNHTTNHATLRLSDASPSAVGAARRFVGEHVAAAVPERTAQAMQLAASELVTNALEHGLPGPITVAVRLEPQRASVAVTGTSEPTKVIPDPNLWPVPGEPSESPGRGLGIVRAVSDGVQVARDGPQVAVTAFFDLD